MEVTHRDPGPQVLSMALRTHDLRGERQIPPLGILTTVETTLGMEGEGHCSSGWHNGGTVSGEPRGKGYICGKSVAMAMTSQPWVCKCNIQG